MQLQATIEVILATGGRERRWHVAVGNGRGDTGHWAVGGEGVQLQATVVVIMATVDSGRRGYVAVGDSRGDTGHWAVGGDGMQLQATADTILASIGRGSSYEHGEKECNDIYENGKVKLAEEYMIFFS